MTKKLRFLIEKLDILQSEHLQAYMDDDPIRVEYVESEIDKLHTLIVAHEAKAMLAAKIKQLDKVLARGGND